MAESKHTLCRRIQCNLMDYGREVPFRERERETVERRLTALEERVAGLATRRRQLEQASNIYSSPPKRPNLLGLGAQIGLTVWLQIQIAAIEEEIKVVSDTIDENRKIFERIDNRLRELRGLIEESEARFETYGCGMDYLRALPTPEDCGLLPLAPMDTIGDREIHFA